MSPRAIPSVGFRRRLIPLALAMLGVVLAVGAQVREAHAGPEPPSVGEGPMVLAGAVWIGGLPAPAGTMVVARIGEVVCGVTLVTEATPGLNYRLTVLAAGERPGCGTDGAPIAILVAGRVADVQDGPLPPFRPGSAVVDLIVP